MLYGASLSLGLILLLLIVWLFLGMLETLGVDMRTAGAIVGFIVLPVIVLLGFPWSFLVSWSDGFVFGLIAGLVINGVLIGMLAGYWVKYKNRKSIKENG